MILATLFSLLLGYLAHWRQRLREADKATAVSTEGVSVEPLPVEWLRPRILVRKDGLVSESHWRAHYFHSREFTIALFLKLSTLFLFLAAVWFLVEVPLPLLAKVGFGLLSLLLLVWLLHSMNGITTSSVRSSTLYLLGPALVVFWLVIYFTQLGVFPVVFTLSLLGASLLALWWRLNQISQSHLYPAVIALALFVPWLLDLTPNVLTAGYLLFIFGLGALAITWRSSAGSAALLSFALLVYGVSLVWWPVSFFTAAFGLVAFLTFLVGFWVVGLELLRASQAWGVAALACLLWVVAVVQFLSLVLPQESYAWLAAITALTLVSWLSLARASNVKNTYVIVLSTLALVFVATQHFFSGYAYTIMTTLQLTLLLTAVTYFGLPNRLVLPVAGLFVWPLLMTLETVFASAWTTGALHLPAYTLYTFAICLLWLGGWFLHRQINASFPWHNVLAAVFGLLTFGTWYLVASLVLYSIFRSGDAFVMVYVTGALLTLMAVYYSVKRQLPAAILTLLASTWLLPAVISWNSFVALRSGIMASESLHDFGLVWVWAVGSLVLLLLVQAKHLNPHPTLLTAVSVSALVFFVYSLLNLYAFTLSFTTSQSVNFIYALVTTVLLILLSLMLRKLNFSLAWLSVVWAFFALPVWLVFGQAFSIAGWEAGVLSVGALTLLGLSLLLLVQLRFLPTDYLPATDESRVVLAWQKLFIGTSVLLLAGYVWSSAHSLWSVEIGTAVSYIILATLGLYFFVRGTTYVYRNWRFVGACLLVLLVIRFFTFEIFSLDFTTRSGIALLFACLFMIGAWLEKRSVASSL